MGVLETARPYLEHLEQLAPQLKEATDRYTDELRQIENRLNAAGLGVSCYLPLGESRLTFGFDKTQQGWHFVVISLDGPYYTPLLHASRNHRLAAAERIPELLELIDARARELIADTQRASAKLSAE